MNLLFPSQMPMRYVIYICCHSDTGEILSRMGAGDFFGEIGILNLDGGVNKYVSCLITFCIRHSQAKCIAVSYTHLTLPTNREV